MSTYIRLDFSAGIIIEREVGMAISYTEAMEIVRDTIRKYSYNYGACTMFKVEYRNN